MPITAKLSRQFYEKLGDEVTNELVTWLNAVDDSYRQEFRELFAANFGRVEAELERIRTEFVARMDALEALVGGKLERMEARLVRWLFVFWIGTLGTVLAILKL